MAYQENPSASFPEVPPTDTVMLIDNRTGRRTTLPILDGTACLSVVDVRSLYGKPELHLRSRFYGHRQSLL